MGFVPTASRYGAAPLPISSPPSPLLHRHHRRVLDAKDGPPSPVPGLRRVKPVPGL
ncbi:hypothetical protein HanIR_Chr05g0244801 [Helianthus annuus]|nr:hypothetical protein HanIR_Chr05g0244801 [Helianthus annuus]